MPGSHHRACVCVCLWSREVQCSALRVSLPGAARCAVLTAAGERCYGPRQLVKERGSTAAVLCVSAGAMHNIYGNAERTRLNLT